MAVRKLSSSIAIAITVVLGRGRLDESHIRGCNSVLHRLVRGGRHHAVNREFLIDHDGVEGVRQTEEGEVGGREERARGMCGRRRAEGRMEGRKGKKERQEREKVRGRREGILGHGAQVAGPTLLPFPSLPFPSHPFQVPPDNVTPQGVQYKAGITWL